MKRMDFVRRHWPRMLATLGILSVLVYTLYHVLSGSSGGLMTTPVQQITDREILGGTGYLFRDETVLYAEEPALVQELAKSGTKVAKGMPLAELRFGYTEKELADLQSTLDLLNRRIAILEESILPSDVNLSQAEVYRKDAAAASLAIRRALQEGDWAALEDLEDSMLIAVNRYAYLTGEADALKTALSDLRELRARLLAPLATTLRNTAASGYFYSRSHVDGYETFFTSEALAGLTPSGLTALASSAPDPGTGFAVGKMAYSYRWHLAVKAEISPDLFEPGERYEVTFPESGGRTLSMTLERIATEQGCAECLLILYSDDVPSDFRFLRAQNVQLSLSACSGYYIPDSALREENGVIGVYIFEESTVRFRRIHVLYYGDGYCIAEEKGDWGEDYLDLYDILITAGKNLYDGKVY